MKKNKAIRKQQEQSKACRRAKSHWEIRYRQVAWLHLWSPSVLFAQILVRYDAFLGAWIWLAKKRATCSCGLCTRDKRKWVGNSWAGKTVQERREIQRADCDEFDDGSFMFYHPLFGWTVTTDTGFERQELAEHGWLIA